MKALSLYQPWASLVALGLKRMETRSWATPYRGPLAIAASKRFPAEARELCAEWPFYEALELDGITSWRQLPTGVVIATCTLVACVPTQVVIKGLHDARGRFPFTAHEDAFGDFSAGRYAWLLADVVKLPEPVPVRGSLGLWEWDGVINPPQVRARQEALL